MFGLPSDLTERERSEAIHRVLRLRDSVPVARRVPLTDLVRANLDITPAMKPASLTQAMRDVLDAAGLEDLKENAPDTSD